MTHRRGTGPSGLRRVVPLGGAVLATAALLVGCSTSSTGDSRTTAAGTGSPSATGSSDFTPSIGTPTPSVTAPTATPTPQTTAPSAPPASGTDCTAAQLTVDALRGSASAGKEFAAILFTNSSGAPCTLTGFPGVSLLAGGRQVGQPAQRDTVAVQTMTLAPGDTVQARLNSIVDCQAPISDTARIYPPNSTQFVDRPLDLRACTLVVGPVGPPD